MIVCFTLLEARLTAECLFRSDLGAALIFFKITERYKLKRRKPKSVFQDRLPEEHPSLT